MSSTILGGDFTVYFLNENRQKRLEWTGSATGTRTVAETFTALDDLMDEPTNMTFGSVISQQTPTEYTIGIIDSGDAEPWFVDRVTVEHMTGASLETSSWARVVGLNTGIVRIDYTETVALIASDIGKTIVMTIDGDSGTILDYNDTTTPKQMWIRPDSDAAGNSFDDAPTANGAFTITGGTGTGTQLNGTSLTGESLWPGVFTLGALNGLSETHMYFEQDGALLTGYKSTTDWWGDSHIDILINVKEVGVEIDEAVVKTFARQSSKTYGFFELDLSAGGRNPSPLSANDDIGNPDGYRQMVITTGATAEPLVGDVITDDTDSTISGVVTSVVGTNPNVTLQYYLIGDPLNDFTGATGTFTGSPSGFTATAVAPTNVNAATYTDVTVAHGSNNTFDVDEDGTNEFFSGVITCASRPLTEVVPRLQYITQRGGVTTTDTDGQEGQFYLGIEWNILYTTLNSGPLNEGATVTQAVTGAAGTVVAHHTTPNILTLRSTRGTFDSTNQIDDDGSAANVTGPTSTQITAKTAAPFGEFPGAARLFLADGMVLSGLASADLNNWETKDDLGATISAPIKVTAAITNTRALDQLALWRLTAAAGIINKAEHTIDVTQGAANTTSIIVNAAIPADNVGKSTGGVIFVADAAGEVDDRYRYTSWDGQTFTLFNIAQATADVGSTQTTLTRVGETFVTKGVLTGDIVYNATESTYAYVSSVDSETSMTMTNEGSSAPVTSWSSDLYHVGATVKAYTTSDTAFVAFIQTEEDTGTDGTPGSESAEVVYLADVPVLLVARQAGVIKPFTIEGTIGSGGFTQAVIRTPQA